MNSFKQSFFLCLLLCTSIVTTSCQPVESGAKKSVVTKAMSQSDLPELDKSSKFVRAQIFTGIEAYETADGNEKGYHGQILSLAGREDIIFADGAPISPSSTCVTSETKAGNSAIDSLLDTAKNHSIVILNENHSNPQHRAFILDVIKMLHSEGFEYYAAETFGDGLFTDTQKIGLASDGFYSNEPLFGRLISFTKSSNFSLVKYEQTREQAAPQDAEMKVRIDTREHAQSDNLISELFDESPTAKVLIHVGHSHVAEKPIRSNKWMAYYLKEKTGINPLTISQTGCSSPSDKIVIAKERVNSEGEALESYTDFFIGHPPLTFTTNRPDWRRVIGDREVKIPKAYLDYSENLIVEARYLNHPDKAVPVDRLAIRPGETGIPLLLPSGTFRVEAFDKNGRKGGAFSVEVP